MLKPEFAFVPNKKTLLEKNGEEFFNTELSKKSNFYNNEFVNEGKKIDY